MDTFSDPTVEITLDASDPANPRIAFSPEGGDLQADTNGVTLWFKAPQPFAIVVVNRLCGPEKSEARSPFGSRTVLPAILSPDKSPWTWAVSASVDIPYLGKDDYYEFCYLVILFTGLLLKPILVSGDPKVIIGKSAGQTANGGAAPAEETFRSLFP